MICNVDSTLKQLSQKNAAVGNIENQAQYDKTLFDLQSYLAHIISDLDMKKGKVLDAGCAYGTFTAFLARDGWDTYALDNMPELISRRWLDRHGIKFAQVNLETDDIPWKDFDLIVFTEVLEHLNYNPVPAVTRLFEATKPGGFIICTTPMKELQDVFHPVKGRYSAYAHYRDIPLPWNGYVFEDEHHYLYGQYELAQLFHEVGFEIIDTFPIRMGKHHLLIAKKPND